MPAPDQTKTKWSRISDRIRSTHELSIVEELTLCFGGRPIMAFIYIFGLILMVGALSLSEWIHGQKMAYSTKAVVAQCVISLVLVASVVVVIICRKRTRRWLFDKDTLLVGRSIRARTKWCARLLPIALSAAIVYLWSNWSR